MFMTEPGYNVILTEPFRQFRDLVAVSGWCAHGFDERDQVFSTLKFRL